MILLKRQAEAEPLRQQVAAFGADGSAYAQHLFFQKVAPSIKTILSDTGGPFGELFRQYVGPRPPAKGQPVLTGSEPTGEESPATGAPSTDATSSTADETQNATGVKQ